MKKIGDFMVVFDSGESVSLDRSVLKYIYKDYRLCVEIERSRGEIDVFFKKNIGWLPPHNLNVISVDKVDEIKNKINEALNFLEVKYQIFE